MSQHTPGPWRVHEPSPEQTTQILTAGGLRVADVWATDLPGGMENARLIAKAPEMYNALYMASDIFWLLSKQAGDVPFWNKRGDGYVASLKIHDILLEIEGQGPRPSRSDDHAGSI